MRTEELADFLRYVGTDPSTLVFEDELTGIHNRRFLLSYLEHRVHWGGDEDFPLALLTMDLDRFKEVNDTYGHETGDQALTWVATLLREVAGEAGIPVRFGGDEFMVLLANTDREEARVVADRLLQRTRDRPFQERETGEVVPITVSVGVAVAPEDGEDRERLFQAADAALYMAKQSGRDRVASASEVDHSTVFSQTAMQRLKMSGIAGREEELNLVGESLRAVDGGRSQVLVFEGAPGSGKTTLLDTISRNLRADETVCVTKVTSDPREASRPYYLATKILINVLSQERDAGAALLADLKPEERQHLAYFLPGLIHEEVSQEVDRETRQGIFKTFSRFLRDVVADRTLILLVDDIQFADEATLILLGIAAEQGGLMVFLCGTVGESLRLSGEAEPTPAERVLAERSEAFGFRRGVLSALDASAVADYMRGVFPDLDMPEGFDLELARVTGGNPFFLTEIVHSLMEDRKVRLEGQRWFLEPLEPDYLARSLEDIVTEKIAALDLEDRDILERASTLGEEIPVSVLTGSSELDESQVQAFLDRAEALGLVSLDFQVNDEVMHFLGKRILDISYKAIAEDRRRELHEEMGRYHERLYEQKLLPSASMLAYHFRRSANDAKAQHYEHAQQTYAASVFESSEAADYTFDEGDTVLAPGEPLGERAQEFLPQVLRTILSAVRNLQLYPEESQAISSALSQAKTSVDAVLEETDRLTFTHPNRVLHVNGVAPDLVEVSTLLTSTVDLMVKAELSGLSLIKGISTTELQAFLGVLGAVPRGSLGRDYWRDIAVESGYTHIEVRQMRFKRVAAADKTPSPSALAAEEALGEHEVSQVPAVLRDLIRATSTARLYPVDSDSVSEAVDALLASLQPLTDRHSAVTLANVDAFVLVNGVRVDTGKWQAVADGFIEFLNTLGLASVTFLYSLSRTDIETFLGLVREGIPSEPDPEFWDGFAEEHGLVGMAFNETGYALGAVRAQGPSTRGAGAGPGSSGTAIGTPGGTYGPPGPAMAPGDAPAPPPGEDVASPDLVARVAKELLAEGKLQEAGTLLERLFADFDQEGTQERVAVVLTCREILRQLVPGLQHTLAKLAVEPLSWALGSETHPRVLEELGTLLYQMAASAVQFADYRLASRIYAVVGERRKELLGTGSGRNTPYAALASVVLDESTQQLLVEDLQSGKPDRQERASLVLSRVGSPARRLLVNVIKQVKELRVRQVAAGMLAEMGEAGALALKETLLTEVVVEHRFRMLEVADLVTDDLRTELAFSVADEHPKIRRAAFQLFERLGNEDLIEVVLPLVEASDPAIAKGAIRSLTHLGTPRAMRAFIDILQKTDDPGLATACCQALGRPESEDAVEALQTVLDRKKLGFLGPWWPEHVRATAAAALLQIGGPWASAVLTQHAKDPSPRIREIARHAGTQGPPQNPISPEG